VYGRGATTCRQWLADAKVQIPAAIADQIATAMRVGQDDLETQRQQSLATLAHRRRAVQAKLDRSYDDHLEGRITEEFWSRKSAEWNTELTTLAAEIGRLEAPIASPAVTAERILELAKRAVFLYEKQDRAEQRKLLESCYRTARSIAELSVRLTLRRSICLRKGTKLKIGWEAGIRTPITASRARCPTVERPPSNGRRRAKPIKRTSTAPIRASQRNRRGRRVPPRDLPTRFPVFDPPPTKRCAFRSTSRNASSDTRSSRTSTQGSST
jgi:hypothetical protein